MGYHFPNILTNPTIQGTVAAGTGLTLPALTLGGTVTGGSQAINDLGGLDLDNNVYITARNNADSADINMIKVNASDLVEFGANLDAFTMGDYLTLFKTNTDGAVEGQLWYDDSENKPKFYDGSDVCTIPASTTDAVAGDLETDMQSPLDVEYATTSTSYVKAFEIVVPRSGVYRIKFDLKRNTTTGSAYGRIYKNGGVIGTQRQTTSTTFVTYSEDITLEAGDIVQLYTKHSTGGTTARVRNLKLFVG